MNQPVFKHFQQLIEMTMDLGEASSESIASAAEKIANSLLGGNRIYSCGEKSATLVAQLFSDYLSLGYEIERPGFAALNINQLTHSDLTRDSYAHCLNTHGRRGDVLLIVSAGNNSGALIRAMEAAAEKDITVILLSTSNDNLLSANVGYNDIEITTAEFAGQLTTAAQFQIIQCICALVDKQIFGGE